ADHRLSWHCRWPDIGRAGLRRSGELAEPDACRRALRAAGAGGRHHAICRDRDGASALTPQRAEAEKDPREAGRRMTSNNRIRRAGNLSVRLGVRCLLGLEDHVDLAAGFQHFPGAGKTGGNHEAVAGAYGLGIAVGITQHGHALEDLAVLVFGVVHRPLAHCAFPDAGAELAAGAAVVVAYALLGVSLEYFFRSGTVVFGGRSGLG